MWKITPTHPVRYSLRSSSNKQSKQSQFNLQINPLPTFFPLTLKWWNNFSLLADFSQTTIEHQISHFIWRRQMKQFVESLNFNTQNHQPDTNFYWHKMPGWTPRRSVEQKFFLSRLFTRVNGRNSFRCNNAFLIISTNCLIQNLLKYYQPLGTRMKKYNK